MHLQPTIYSVNLKQYMLPCLNKKMFGLECPGCGMQRSVQLFVQGEFAAAFTMYPAIYPMMVLLLFLISTLFVKFRFAEQLKLMLILTTAGFIVVSYLLKMNDFFN